MKDLVVVLKNMSHHYDMASGVRNARATFESEEMVHTNEGLKAAARVEVTIQGSAQISEIERIKRFIVSVSPYMSAESTVVIPPANDLSVADLKPDAPKEPTPKIKRSFSLKDKLQTT